MQITEEIVEKIQSGAVGVMPTDTIYGIVASTRFPDALGRIYRSKGRTFTKKLIHLVSGYDQFEELGIYLSPSQKSALDSVWPGPVSIELSCDDTKPYLHKGTFCIAVRMPKDQWLRDFVAKTGPVVATSANKSGEPTPQSIEEIKKQLPGLDFYLEGKTGVEPSRLARLLPDGKIEWLSRS